MKRILRVIAIMIALSLSASLSASAKSETIQVYVNNVPQILDSFSNTRLPDSKLRLPLNAVLDKLNVDYRLGEYGQFVFTFNGKDVSVPPGETYYYLDGTKKQMSCSSYKVDSKTLLMPLDFFADCFSANVKVSDNSTEVYFTVTQEHTNTEVNTNTEVKTNTDVTANTEVTTNTEVNANPELIARFKNADIKLLFSCPAGLYALDEKTGNTIAIDESFDNVSAWSSMLEKLEPYRYKKLVTMDDNYIYFIDVTYLYDVVESNLYRINKDGTQKTLIDSNVDIEQDPVVDEQNIFYKKTLYTVTSNGYSEKSKVEGIFKLRKGELTPKRIINKDYQIEGITKGFLVLSEFVVSSTKDNIYAYNTVNGKLLQLPTFTTYCTFISPVDGLVYYGNDAECKYYYIYDPAKRTLKKSSVLDPLKISRRGSTSNYIFYEGTINGVLRTFAYDRRKGYSLTVNTQTARVNMSQQFADNIMEIEGYNDDFYYYKEMYSYGDSLADLFNLDKCVIYKSYLGKNEKVLFSTPSLINKIMVINPRDLVSGVYIKVNGQTLNFPDARPFIDGNGRTQMPVRFISEALGAKVDWEASTRTVIITKGVDTVSFKIGEKSMVVNGQEKELDTAATIKNGRTFVPLRFVSEAFGTTIEWDPDTNTATIK